MNIKKWLQERKFKKEIKTKTQNMRSWYETKLSEVETSSISYLCKLQGRQFDEIKMVKIQLAQTNNQEKIQLLTEHLNLAERLISRISDRVRRSFKKVA